MDELNDQPPKVPEDVMKRLHEANERFHSLRKQMIKTEDDSELSHEERVDSAHDALWQAEKDVEAMEAEVAKILKEGQPQ